MDANDITSAALKRRKLLVAGAAGVGAVLYGATLFESPATGDPSVPASSLDGWQRVADTDRTDTLAELGPVRVQTALSTHQYEHRALGQQVRNRPVETTAGGRTQSKPLGSYVGDGFGNTLMTFSATHVDLSPDLNNLPLGVGRAEITDAVVDTAAETLEDQLRSAGATAVEQTGRDELEVETGETAEVVEYSSEIPVDGFTVAVGGTDVAIPADSITVTGKLAVWNHGDYVVIATGSYPGENYSVEVTETTDDGDEVTISFDLGLAPADHEGTISDLIAQVR